MDSFSFSSAYTGNLPDLILHFEKVKIKLEELNQQNLIPFHDTYLLITKTVAGKIRTGYFENDGDMSLFVISFARFYFDALDQYFKGQSCSVAWMNMFSLCKQNQLPRFAYLLLGVHAHINHDLSQCVRNAGFADSFKKDYLAINAIIEGKLAEAITQIDEKSLVLKRILKMSLFIYKVPVHQIIVLCRNLAWEKSQQVDKLALAYL